MDTTTKFATAGFLYNPKTKSVLLHHRDGNTKFNPHKWAFFGGLGEGTETPLDGFVRELSEEINLEVNQCDVIPLRDYLNEELNIWRHLFFVISDVEISALTLGEGAGFEWVPFSYLDDYDLTKRTREDLDYFIENYVNKK